MNPQISSSFHSTSMALISSTVAVRIFLVSSKSGIQSFFETAFASALSVAISYWLKNKARPIYSFEQACQIELVFSISFDFVIRISKMLTSDLAVRKIPMKIPSELGRHSARKALTR